uniref:Uncharacterized protein n=1 Tax=Helianthus annuus TaxID=4232 RepID=A0A251TFY5_HELAN
MRGIYTKKTQTFDETQKALAKHTKSTKHILISSTYILISFCFVNMLKPKRKSKPNTDVTAQMTLIGPNVLSVANFQ